MIAIKFRKALDDSLACFRVVGADDEIMLSTFQVRIVSSECELYIFYRVVSNELAVRPFE